MHKPQPDKTPDILPDFSKLIPGLDSLGLDKLKTQVDTLTDLGENKEGVAGTIEKLTKGMQGIFDWFGDLFKGEKPKESAGIMTAFVGVLSIFGGSKIGKIADFFRGDKDNSETATASNERKEGETPKGVKLADLQFAQIPPVEKVIDGEKKMVYYCSKNARTIQEGLGCTNVQRGHAMNVRKEYEGMAKQGKVELIKSPDKSGLAHRMLATGHYVFDLLAKGSDTEMGKKYGHRATGVVDENGKVYVLDPDLRNRKNEDGEKIAVPIPIEKYPRQIFFAVAMESTKYPAMRDDVMYAQGQSGREKAATG